MDIDKKDVLHVADLARLALTDDETALYTEQLGKILGYVTKLSDLDTGSIKDTGDVGAAMEGAREDRVAPSLEREKAIMNAPEKARGCFKVPRIID